MDGENKKYLVPSLESLEFPGAVKYSNYLKEKIKNGQKENVRNNLAEKLANRLNKQGG